MNKLETALITHDWSLDGWRTRPQVDQLMKSHPDPAEAQTLWQQHCPWSDSNGGYVAKVLKKEDLMDLKGYQ